jgi:hypothetical protein
MSNETETIYRLELDLIKELDYQTEYDGDSYYSAPSNAWDEDELLAALKELDLDNMDGEPTPNSTVTFKASEVTEEDGTQSMTFTVETNDEGMLHYFRAQFAEVASDYADESSLTEHRIDVINGQVHKATLHDTGRKDFRVDGRLVGREYPDGQVETIDLDTGIKHTVHTNGTVSQSKNGVRIRDDHPDGRSMIYDEKGRGLHGVTRGGGLSETHFEDGKITLEISESGDKTRYVGEQIVVERAWGNTEYYNKATVDGLFPDKLQKVVAHDGSETTFKDGFPHDGKLHYANGHACEFSGGKAISGTKAMDEYVNQCGYLGDCHGRKIGLETYANGQLVSKTRFGLSDIAHPTITVDFNNGEKVRETVDLRPMGVDRTVSCYFKGGEPHQGQLFSRSAVQDLSTSHVARHRNAIQHLEQGRKVAVATLGGLGGFIHLYDDQGRFSHQVNEDGRVFSGVEKADLHSLVPASQKALVAEIVPHTASLYEHLPPEELAQGVVDVLAVAGVDVPNGLAEPVAAALHENEDLTNAVLDSIGTSRAQQAFEAFAITPEVKPAPDTPEVAVELSQQGPRI